MKIVRRDPDKAYLSCWLEVPKKLINVAATQSALNFLFTDGYTGKQRVEALWRDAPHHLLVPRAFWDPASLPCEVVDVRPRSYAHFDFKSRIQLDHLPVEVNGKRTLQPTGDDVQRKSMHALTNAMGGVLQLRCGAGKSVITLEKIAQAKVPALIVVDNTNLLEQWEKEILLFLDVPGGIGYMMAGKNDWQKGIVLATYQTLASRADELDENIRRWFGQVFWDEGHHISAPTFARTASLFYGKRYSLTATPERDDGLHVIAQFHLGAVLHKDLRQPLKARIVFKWTGLALDITDQAVAGAVMDVNGEVHLSKMKSFFGRWRDRLAMILQDACDAVQAGRKVLVLTDSVDEAVNLMTLATRGWSSPLYSDIPYPAPAEVGETLAPLSLSEREVRKLEKLVSRLQALVASGQHVEPNYLHERELELRRFEVHKKLEAEYARRQRAFLKQLLEEPSQAGLMTYGVPPKVRQQLLHSRPLTFAITKYGKEGLDCTSLDTVLVSSLFSKRSALQQLMGRPTRPKPGKKSPLVVFYVDNEGQCIGMSQKLQKHLRQWPHEEGGPFDLELFNYPIVTSCRLSTLKEAFGQ